MKQQDYLELIAGFEASSLTCLEIEEETYRIHMEKPGPASASGPALAPAFGASSAPASAPPHFEESLSGSGRGGSGRDGAGGEKDGTGSSEDGCVKVKAPLVGVFYAAPSPGGKPFAEAGSRVEKGQTLCLIEAMKMMNELRSPVSGVVRAVRGSDGQLAEYGQVLFEVEPC